jgi:hypothetical protein
VVRQGYRCQARRCEGESTGDSGWDIRIVAPEKTFDQFALLSSKMLASVQLAK